MGATFYFYDLETSGFNPRSARIMQFAGQRTDLDLKPLGEPDNFLIKITPDVLPDPDAVLVTGITPQATLADGITESEFTKILINQVCTPDTIMVGYNNIRFDDEFLRFTLWRNFYDAYEWHWKDGCSRWDLLDVVRLTRALRPDGIEWPFASDGKPTNRLEFLSAVNNLEHTNAHNALSDVSVTIDLAKLINTKQPKLFDYLLSLRDKKKVEALISSGQPVVYTSGRYSSDFEKTTVAVRVADNPFKGGALMYDLRIDPGPFLKMTPTELHQAWNVRGQTSHKETESARDLEKGYFPVKTLAYNRCPAVSPLSVLNKVAQERIKINMDEVKENLAKLRTAKDFGAKLTKALEASQPIKQTDLMRNEQEVDSLLYDSFIPDADKTKMRALRVAQPDEFNKIEFADARLKTLLPLYKARNFPKSLNQDEQQHWEEFRAHKLLDGGQNSQAARYITRLAQLGLPAGRQGAANATNSQSQYLLEELYLYAQAIIPVS